MKVLLISVDGIGKEKREVGGEKRWTNFSKAQRIQNLRLREKQFLGQVNGKVEKSWRKSGANWLHD